MATKPIDEMTVRELKDELRDRDLKLNGNKSELVERLREALEGEGTVMGDEMEQEASIARGADFFRRESPKTKRRSSTEKKKKSTSPKKKSPSTPGTKATDFDEGTVKKGRGGDDYEVAVNKSGRKYWRKCTASTAKCGTKEAEMVEEVSEEVDTEEWNKLVSKKVPNLKKLASKKDPNYEKKYGKLVKYQLIMFLLTGLPGDKPPKGTSPKRKKVTTPPVSPKRKRTGTTPPVSPKKKPKKTRKGKERGEPEPESEIQVPEKATDVGRVTLDRWTVIGELDPLFVFLQEESDSYDDLLNKIQERIDETPTDQIEGSENIVRFEPDPTCDVASGTCGAQALGVRFEEGEYDIFAERTKAEYLKEIYVGPFNPSEMSEAKADFGLLRNLVVADLRVLRNLVDKYDSATAMLNDLGDGDIIEPGLIILSNPAKARRTYLMDVDFVIDGKGRYRAARITRT